MTLEELNQVRSEICAARSIQKWAEYDTKQVMHILGMTDDSWIKRHRDLIPHTMRGGKYVYLGVHIADFIAFGDEAGKLHPKVETWANTVVESSRSESSTSRSGAKPSTGADTTQLPDRQNAILSALRTKAPQS